MNHINAVSGGASRDEVAGPVPIFGIVGVVAVAVLVGMFIFAMLHPGCTETGSTGALADISTLGTNIVRYRTMAGVIPSQAQGLEALAKKPTGNPVPKTWHKLTDETTLIDPWGHPYQYRNPGKRNPSGYDIYSLGPDGVDGTPDDIYTQ